jgi:3-oxoacyl-[acyl-carrier-protein] synthase-1
MKPLQVQGWGMQTALGNAESTLLSLRLGQSGFAEHPRWVGINGERFILALSPDCSPVLLVTERLLHLAEQALNDLLHSLPAEMAQQQADYVLPVLLGVSEQQGVTRDDHTHLSESFGQTLGQAGWPNSRTRGIYGGHCITAHLLGQASALLADSKAPYCLVGVVDSWANPPRLEALDEAGLLHRQNQRGFIPGEAAAFCLLSLHDESEAQGTETSHPLIRQVASDTDPFRVDTEDTPTGQALTQACHQALQTLPAKKQIQQVYADFNGERWRATEYGFSSLRLAPWLSRTDQFTPLATGIGDVGAATGLTQVVHAIRAAHKGFHPGRHSLLWQADTDGKRSAILLKLPQQTPQLRQ